MKKIMISVPTRDGYIHGQLVRSVIAQMAGRPLRMVAGVVPLEMARNKIVETFMESDCTHLFMVDADTIPPVDTIDRLLALDTDIATGITPIVNKDGITSNVFTHMGSKGEVLPMDEVVKKKEPFEITAVGMACALIKREVFEKLEKPYFTSLWFQNGEFCEGDVHFCGKVIDAGFRIVADPTLVCNHVKQVTV